MLYDFYNTSISTYLSMYVKYFALVWPKEVTRSDMSHKATCRQNKTVDV